MREIDQLIKCKCRATCTGGALESIGGVVKRFEFLQFIDKTLTFRVSAPVSQIDRCFSERNLWIQTCKFPVGWVRIEKSSLVERDNGNGNRADTEYFAEFLFSLADRIPGMPNGINHEINQ